MAEKEFKMEIEWEGHYEQGGSKNPVHFNDMHLNIDGTIVGGGKDAVGEFAINGKIEGPNVTFVKAYKGAHSVDYKGTLNHGTIIGKWSVGGAEGGFEIKMKTKIWTGKHQTADGQLIDLVSSLQFQGAKKHHRDHVSGIGYDVAGNFRVSGFKPVVGEHHTVMFTKEYFGTKEKIQYTGICLNEGGHDHIRGYWINSAKQTGTFSIIFDQMVCKNFG